MNKNPGLFPIMMAITLAVFPAALMAQDVEPAAGKEMAMAIAADSSALEWGPCPDFFATDCAIAVLNIDEDGRNADVFFRYPAGESFVEHWHTSAERIVVMEGTLEVTYEGQETATVHAGEYAFGPPMRKHSGACVSDEDCLLFIAFEEAPDTHPVVASN